MASFKKRANGKTQIIITHGKRFDGKPKRYYREVSATSKKELEREAALFYSDIVNGVVTAGNDATIEALFNDFMKRNKQLSVSSQARYKQLYNNQIKKYFGKRKVNKITRMDIRDWVDALADHGNVATGKGLAPKTIHSALSLLSTMYTYAIHELEIADKNPCERIPVGTIKKKVKEEKYYTNDELKELLGLLSKELDNSRSITHATMIHLILFTGMRNGEAMGLKWEDVDFGKNQIDIKRERLSVSTLGTVEDSPKTESSARTISVPAFVMDMLKELKKTQELWASMNEDWQDTGYVAATVNGTPQHPHNTYRWFQYFLKKNNLKHATVHDLRHTHAAMLSSMGVKIIDISKRLGHSNTRVTQEVYEYLFRDVDDKVSAELGNFYENVVKM